MTQEEMKENLVQALSPVLDVLSAALTSNETPVMPDISALETAIDELRQGSSFQQESLDILAETIGNIGSVYATKEENKSVETRLVQLQKAVRTNIDGIASLTEIMSSLGEQINAVSAALEELEQPPTEEEPPVEEPTDPETPSEPETPVGPEVPSPPVNGAGEMGIALGMGMGKPEVVPGEVRYDFELPVEADIDRAMSYGIRLFRVGSLRERLIMPGGNSELYLGTHTSQFGGQKPRSLPEIRDFCKLAASKGCKVMLDLFHNYGGFSETGNAKKDNNPGHKKIGTTAMTSYDIFANDWKAIIEYLKADPEAWDGVYGLDILNEWVGLPSDNVFYATQRFLDVCAPIMDDKLAVIEGNAYSNTPNFWDHNPRFKDLVDPRGPGFIEMSGHLYADADYSGMYKTGDTVRSGENFDTFYVNRVKPFLDGCEQYGFKANVGEWICPGDHPKLLEGSRKGIEYALDRGCNFFVFGMGRGFSPNASNHWNLEIARNVPTLEVVKALAARNK